MRSIRSPDICLNRLLDPGHRRVFRVLCLDPVWRRAGTIRAVPMFGNQPLEPEFASLAEQIRADFALLEGCDEDAVGAPCQQSGEIGLAQAQWELAQIYRRARGNRMRKAEPRHHACGYAIYRNRKSHRRRVAPPRRRPRMSLSGCAVRPRRSADNGRSSCDRFG